MCTCWQFWGTEKSFVTQHICCFQSAMPSTGAGNDFQKDKQFRKLNAQKDIVEVTVVRGGSNKLIPNTGVVVGDVLVLTTGDKVTAGMCTIA